MKKYMKLYNTKCFTFKTLHTNFKLKQVSSHIVMPKVSTSSTSKIDSYVWEFPKEFKKTPRNELYCTICNTTINHERRSTVVKHQETSKHIKGVSNMNSTLVQQCIPSEFTNQAEYLTRVVKAFLSADIPIYKSNNPELKSLFTFFGRPLPSESSLRSQVTVPPYS